MARPWAEPLRPRARPTGIPGAHDVNWRLWRPSRLKPPGIDHPVFLLLTEYAYAPGIEDPYGVQGFAMATGRMRILTSKKKQKNR